MTYITWNKQPVPVPPKSRTPPRARVDVDGQRAEIVEVFRYQGDGFYYARLRLVNGEECECIVDIERRCAEKI